MYVFESSGVAYIDVFHSSKHVLAFSLNWHRSVVEQGLSSRGHFNLCCTVSSSAPHWQFVFVAESTKPHFLSSVLVLATPVRRRLRHRSCFVDMSFKRHAAVKINVKIHWVGTVLKLFSIPRDV